MLKKITLKISLLLIMIVAMNFIYAQWFLEKDRQKHAEMMNAVNAIPKNTDIIYIGESSNDTFGYDDTDTSAISDFIGEQFPGLNVFDITIPAAHAGIFKVILENIPGDCQARTLIVTLNMRSFNAQWIYSDMETALRKRLLLFTPGPPLLNRFKLSFKAYDIKSPEEREKQVFDMWRKDSFDLPYDFKFKDVTRWDRWVAWAGIRDSSGQIDTAASILACHYVKAYGFQLDTINNPRIRDFNDIIELAGRRNWNLVFNLLAENTEKAYQLVGQDLVYMINKNAQMLEAYYTKKGVSLVNNLNEVDDDQFVDRNWTTEHYAEKGRRTIATNVAEALKAWHGDHYLETDTLPAEQTIFYTDCEMDTIWGQWHTLCDEAAFSGKRSSKTGKGNDFSIALEYPMKDIPDNHKQSISIEFWAYQTSLEQEARIVFEASGSHFNYYWNAYALKQDIRDTNRWRKFHRKIMIPDSIKQADLFKVYLFNTSDKIIYIDDIKVKLGE